MAKERQLIRIPNGPNPGAGISQILPGVGDAQRQVQPVKAGRIRLSTAAPAGEVRQGGVIQDGQALSLAERAQAEASLSTGRAAAQAVGAIGEGLSAIGKKVLHARETAELIEADQRMSEAWELYAAALPEDPSSWEEGRKAKSDAVRASLLDPNLKRSRSVTRKLERNLQAWDAETSTRLGSMAIRQEIAIAKVKSRAAQDYAVENGDMEKFAEVSAAMVAAGLSTPELEGIRMRDADAKIGRTALSRTAETDPWKAEEILKAVKMPWMTENDRYKFGRYIEEQKGRVTRDGVENIAFSLDQYPDMDEKTFGQLLDSVKGLSNEHRKTFRDRWMDGSKPDFDQIYAMRDEITKTMTEGTPLHERYAMETRIAAEIPPKFRGYMKQVLSGSMSEGTDPVLRHGHELISSMVKSYLPRADAFEAKKFELLTSQEYSDWRIAHPDATLKQGQEFLESLGVTMKESRDAYNLIGAPGVFDPNAVKFSTPDGQTRGFDALAPVEAPPWYKFKAYSTQDK
jgi:hypothetical protein